MDRHNWFDDIYNENDSFLHSYENNIWLLDIRKSMFMFDMFANVKRDDRRNYAFEIT